MSKIIELTQGQIAIVDNEWFDELNKHKWYAWWSKRTKSFYALRAEKDKKVYMHRIVANTPDGMDTDHINHDTLDNQSSNLRNCTYSQNRMNRGIQSNNTSGFKGVFKSGKNWTARIRFNGNCKRLGTYATKEEAALAYDEAAKQYHGEFAMLNFPK